ncbi:type IV toxin-antitoxin system AbiEi family antitoxin domain-containing protein [Caenimonas koreensis]|uniref:Transcriptional regulator n=1 Tax=Caenimonas koreensis DSM 17982 TaxID=1121255 RepID=A0A844B9R5_9BURK|nr:type IV toxin-antitoxin system AbiEi family antitoxin domain-containing protein [Caenimonas koreensis]MRD47271.1 transcriptional regulator [Caenimonas koreensis DSM 17982]
MATASTRTHEQLVLSLAKKRPLLRARDVQERSIPTAVLGRLVATGKLERVGRGVYSLPGSSISEHRSIAEVALRVPQGVICLLSALRMHDIGTQSPFEVWLAIPNNHPAPRFEQPAIRTVRMSSSALSQGVEERMIEGVQVKVFNVPKTIADAFKYRNKIGNDVAIEALREGWAERKFKMDELWRYAAVDRVTNVMRPYLEGLTA